MIIEFMQSTYSTPLTTEAQYLSVSKRLSREVLEQHHFQVALRDTGLYPGLIRAMIDTLHFSPRCDWSQASFGSLNQWKDSLGSDDTRSLLELIISRKLVKRKSKLASGRTIGELETTGLIHLVRKGTDSSEIQRENDETIWRVNLPFIVFKQLNSRLKPDFVIPDEILSLPNHGRRWTMSDLQLLHAHFIRSVLKQLRAQNRTPTVGDIFVGGMGVRRILGQYIDVSPELRVYKEKSPGENENTPFTTNVQCYDGITRDIKEGIFICGGGGRLVDQRLVLDVCNKNAKPVAVFVKLHDPTEGVVSSGQMTKWYKTTMSLLENYEGYEIVLVFITGQKVLDRVNFDLAPGLIIIQGLEFEHYWTPTFSHRAFINY